MEQNSVFLEHSLIQKKTRPAQSTTYWPLTTHYYFWLSPTFWEKDKEHLGNCTSSCMTQAGNPLQHKTFMPPQAPAICASVF